MKQIINTIRDEWVSGTWKPVDAEHWGGAGLIVTDKPRKDTAVVVVTQHAGRVSCLIETLRDRLRDYLNYENKYEFYPRIGEAANKAIVTRGDTFPAIADAVLKEASLIASEWDAYYYYAYGSNMDETQMICRCPGAKLLGKGIVEGYRFAIDNRGVATILPSKADHVEGLLWRITKRDIAELDRYEGVAGGYYRKEILSVYSDHGFHNALVYLSNAPCDEPGYRPEYLDRVVYAAEKHSLAKGYIASIQAYSNRIAQ